MKLDFKKLLPRDPSSFSGFRAVRLVTAAYLVVAIARSAIHLFAPDGGANSIASVDISVEGGNNIIAIFHQWGAIQLLLALMLVVLFVRYPGLTPLIILTLALDPILRAVAGRMEPLTTQSTPPGESLNWLAFGMLATLLIVSLMTREKGIS